MNYTIMICDLHLKHVKTIRINHACYELSHNEITYVFNCLRLMVFFFSYYLASPLGQKVADTRDRNSNCGIHRIVFLDASLV